MKIVVICLPNNVNVEEIKEACGEFAQCLDLESVKVNVLEEGDLQIENPISTVSSVIDSIIMRCANQDPLITIANFWRCVSVGEINKSHFSLLLKHRSATKAYLKKKNLECFLSLFDEAFKRM